MSETTLDPLYVESGLDIPCDKESLQEIWNAMASEEKLEALIQHYSRILEIHVNTDY